MSVICNVHFFKSNSGISSLNCQVVVENCKKLQEIDNAYIDSKAVEGLGTI